MLQQIEALEMVTPYMYHYYIEALLKCNADEEKHLLFDRVLGWYGAAWCRYILGAV